MGQKSIAAGLWGRDDYEQMFRAMRPLNKHIKTKMTPAVGSTRRNITVVDTVKGREIHLRDKSRLASVKSLKKLRDDLGTIVRKGSVCVFAGTMPDDDLLDGVIGLMEFCKSRGAKIVLDTSGPALKRMVHTDLVWLIKPNVEELCELSSETIKDGPVSLAKAGRGLLDRVGIVLISRGGKGSVVVTEKAAWQARSLGRAKVFSTVGCGDYLLAGFLEGLMDTSDVASALSTAIKVATAKAWDWIERKTWPEAGKRIKVKIDRI
jgi:fructose-1-phosphate kinase PfkB-like protein